MSTGKSKIIVIGIDPGLHGAISMLDGERGDVLLVMDTPFVRVKDSWTVRKSSMDRVDKVLDGFKKKTCIMERMYATGRDGREGILTLGTTYGAMFALFCHRIDGTILLVRPKEWKKYFHLSSDKQLSIDLVKKLYPKAGRWIKRKMDHGRAESILIARYYLERYVWEKEH